MQGKKRHTLKFPQKEHLKEGVLAKDLNKFQEIKGRFKTIADLEKQILHQQEKREEIWDEPTSQISRLEDIFEEEEEKKRRAWIAFLPEEEEKEVMIWEMESPMLETQSANGNGFQRGGLWNHEIDKIMKPFKFYIKTITIDELPQMFDKIKEEKPSKFAFIVNTEKKENKIGHWIAVYCDLKNDYTCEVYDPFAYNRKELYSLLKNYFWKLMEKYKLPFYAKFKTNSVKQQSVSSSNCGWFCIRFLLMRHQNVPFKKATEYKWVKENEKNIEC